MPAAIEIRPAEPGDAARIRAWRALPAAWAALSADPLVEADGQRGERQDFLIETAGTPVGLLSLYELDRKNGRGAYAAYVAEPGPGIGDFAEYWMLEYAFEGLKLAKLWCETPALDEGARMRHEGFGFRREACLRGHLVREGAKIDVIGYGILAGEWRAQRAEAMRRLRAKGFEPPES